MGLYLCIFEDDEEIDGVEVGPYADFDGLRSYVRDELEGGKHGARFPVFMLHSDCDGQWEVQELAALKRELGHIVDDMRARPSRPFISEWQGAAARANGVVPHNAYESFVDVDGEFVLGRIESLVGLALERGLLVIFQ